MRRIITILICLSAVYCHAQNKLTTSRTSSYYTYIYKISDTDLLKLYKNPDLKPDEKMLGHPIDSVKNEYYFDEDLLPPGNYLKVKAEKNTLSFKLIEKRTAFVHILRSEKKIDFILTDRAGNIIRNAVTSSNNKLVQLDTTSGIYSISAAKHTIIQIRHNDVNNFYKLEKISNKFRYTPPGFLSAKWLKVKWYKLKQWFKPKSTQQNRQNYTGFMVFNKPKYKPNDTVRFKAFIINKKTNKPLAVPRVLVKLKQDYNDDIKTLGIITSYRAGAFEYSFVLSDSLDLDLDEDYKIALQQPDEPARKKTNTGDKDNHLTYLSGDFNYEEYELKSTKFSMRADKKEHSPGDLVNIYLKATDENDLPVPDGRVNLIIKTTRVGNHKATREFIPDTLWRHSLTLDAIGETKLSIPDSVFPKADIDYTLHADFYNSSNEHREAETDFNYEYKADVIKLTTDKDTLRISAFKNGKPLRVHANIYGIGSSEDTIARHKVMLPAAVKIQADAVEYEVETDSAYNSMEMDKEESGITIQGHIKNDSVLIKVQNERKLHFWYQLYEGKKLIRRGAADSLTYHQPVASKHNITCVVNYRWAGRFKHISQIIDQLDKQLHISIKQPLSVYPGQKVTTVIDVKNHKGEPVPNTDVTAWAYTGKFEQTRRPFIPYLGERRKSITLTDKFNTVDLETTSATPLEWKRWRTQMGLDSIEYYRFTHPSPIYRIEEAANEGITQIAPFVVINGDITPVHILYIDERPVYFSRAGQLQRYSFKVDTGKHTVRFRTIDRDIKLSDIYAVPNKKLIVSINADSLLNKQVSIKSMPDSLTDHEASLLNKYMINVVNNFNGRLATLEQTDKLMLLSPLPTHQREILAGPLSENVATIDITGKTRQTFLSEPGYAYTFLPGMLKQKSIPGKYSFTRQLKGLPPPDYKQYTLTRKETDSLWNEHLYQRSNTTWLFYNEPAVASTTGRLVVDIKNERKLGVKNIILYRHSDPDFMNIYPGDTRSFGNLSAGRYRMFILLKNRLYYLDDNITVKPYGENYYDLTVTPHAEDAVSIRIDSIINTRVNARQRNDNDILSDATLLREAFNKKYINDAVYGNTITGVVRDGSSILPGATVRVKGLPQMATTTDHRGSFTLRVPPRGKFIVQFIGYKTLEFDITPGEHYNIKLTPMQNSLEEVVVVGYGSVKRMNLMGAVSGISAINIVTESASTIENFLTGRLPGFFSQENGRAGASSDFFIRGLSTSIGGGKPLIIVDGEEYTYEQLQRIDVNEIESIAVLKDAASAAIYGTKGKNGVLVVTTKGGRLSKLANNAAGVSTAGLLRRNFSDYAYWQPKLTTDGNGRATFTSTMPDDITNWRNFVIAVNDNRQTGYAENNLKSFKPLSATFISPQFAVEGDKLTTIGKVMNYGAKGAKVNRRFLYNGSVLNQDSLQIVNSQIDSLQVNAGNTDSLSFEYAISKTNGYFDGELRKIPVVKQGVQETKGHFEALRGDTTVNMQFDTRLGPVTFHAEASILPVLLAETSQLRDYKYLCNEQLASKLKGLMAEKRINAYLRQPFAHDKYVKELIKKLQESRSNTGLWGWWQNSNDELWISLHAVEALLDAQSQGYQTGIDKQKLTDYLIHQLESYYSQDKITCIEILNKLNAKVDYKKYAQVIHKELLAAKSSSAYYKMRILLLLQHAGIKIDTYELLNDKKTTLFGNVYWGEKGYHFFDNSMQLTIMAYRILKNDGNHAQILERITGYLLEQRRDGGWRNTYESSLILETILPELLANGEPLHAPRLTLSGATNQDVTAFPYNATFTGTSLQVSKTGTLPVYITGYQQFWNSKPEKVNKDFTVDTWFEKGSTERKVTQLKGGEKVELAVKVTVKGDGEFVMIEVPIPAGCSYDGKEQSWGNNEVHREYFKEKVSIFCRRLKQGTHQFTVKLMPRYDGEYTLNPAKAELMYFPVFYGREGIRKVVIGDR
ncbi:hypothetical protein DJ568_00425 [Mucilaginibacter hurinus]|uniref:Alpha-2-macroglobulin domain-containing protein n=1 Tax=Mucilaginibacter hurinus TaxID=2201324 RepID=A0A367GSY7_9SPHI|nr:alpha-2-macroglobulin family protein [Mucilaginibacter hurinus]RCH56360.1 hypothetical protein DJ568_00425 [Mucilaginibacter hurinus]